MLISLYKGLYPQNRGVFLVYKSYNYLYNMVVPETVSRKVLESLRGIGLNLYERNLYTAILIKKVATASELSELSRVPRARVYDVLESLEQKGFVVVQHGSPFKYVAVEPKEAFENLKSNIKKEAELTVTRLEELKKSEIMADLVSLYKKDLKMISPGSFNAVIKSEDKIRMQTKTLLSKAKTQVNILTSEKGIADLKEHMRSFSKLKSKNVEINIMGPITTRNRKQAMELLPYANLKHLEGVELPLGKLQIIDGEHVLMGLVNDTEIEPSQEIAFWTQSSHVANELMTPIFKQLWTQAKDITKSENN